MAGSRILIITPEYTLGGAETQLRHILYALEDRGYGTDVCVLNAVKTEKDPLLEADAGRMRNVAFFELGLTRKSEYREREEIRSFLRKNLERGYDVVLLFHERLVPLIPFFRERGIATVYSERLEGERICTDETCRPFAVESDILTANSAYATKRMERVFHREVRLIPNGKEPRERLAYVRNGKITNILVPCRIDPVKNLAVVVDMATAHLERGFEIRFVGEKEHKDHARALEGRVRASGLESSIHFTGYKYPMEEEYRWADVVLLPSLAEGTPNVVLEAFQYGRPVIVSDIGPERAIVKDKGLRFPPKDAEALYACICYLEDMPDDQFEGMLSDAHRYVLEAYDLSKMTDAFIKILEEARELGKRPEPAAGYEACLSELRAVIGEHEKKEQFYACLCKWNMRLQEHDSIVKWFIKNGYFRVSIYGFRELGKLLYRELSGSEVKVICIIDRNADKLDGADVPVLLPDVVAEEEIDIIVVTAIAYYASIKETLTQTWKCPVVSLEDVVYEDTEYEDTEYREI